MSTTFSIDAQTLINGVLRLQGWLDYTAGDADATKSAQMLEALNIMVKGWSSKGLKVWTIEQVQVPLVAGQAAYNMGPSSTPAFNRPERIEYALLRQTSTGQQIDRPLYSLSRADYLLLGNKFSPGPPNQYFYDPQVPNGVLYLYNCPDFYTVANYICLVYIRQYVQDIPTLTSSTSFPQEWYQALRWGLAYETMEENQCTPAVCQMIDRKANKFIGEMEDWDREYTDVMFGLDTQRGTGQ